MFSELLRAEWDRRRALLALLCLVFAAGPLQYLSLDGEPGFRLARRLAAVEANAGLLTAGMVVLSACWGAGAWTPERRSRWVYALSLPVGRVRMFAARYAVSLAWLALPVALLGAASALVAPALHLPRGVYAYPLQYTAWTAVLCWMVFSVAFVLAARFEKPTRALLVPVAALVALQVLPQHHRLTWLRPVADYVGEGPLSPLRMVSEYTSLVGY